MKVGKKTTPNTVVIFSGSFFLISLILMLTIYYFDSCRFFFSWKTCDYLEIGYIRPFVFVMFAIFVSALPYKFGKIMTYKTWLRFSTYWILLTILLLALSPVGFNGGPTVDFFPDPPRDEIALFLSTLFILISWSIALWGFVKRRRK